MDHKTIMVSVLAVAIALVTSCELFQNNKGTDIPNQDIWVNGYLAAWQHNIGPSTPNSPLNAEDIDWNALTYLTYFSLPIAPNGTPLESLNPREGSDFNAARLEAIVSAAHSNETTILFAVGGLNNYSEFSSAIEEENRDRLINTIIGIINNFNFDGVSLNMTPIEETDYDNYWRLIIELRSALDTVEDLNEESLMMTVATAASDSSLNFFSFLQDYLDQINIMTYNMALPFRGWQAWHNSALINENVRLEGSRQLFPSIDQIVNKAITEGIDENKIGIGINFYGYRWNTVHFMEKWENWPSPDFSIIDRPEGIPYTELRSNYNLEEAIWDDQARVPYLNVEEPRAFISFENEESITQKVEYAKKNRLGGVMIWELGGGYFPNNLRGVNDPLLQAVKKAAVSE